MSFKFIFLLLFIAGCGVKSVPTAPKDSSYPTYQSQFIPLATPTPLPKATPDNSQ